MAESGQRDMQGRLARAFRDGRGVPKDLNLAAEWMRKAADQGLPWAVKEYNMLCNNKREGNKGAIR